MISWWINRDRRASGDSDRDDDDVPASGELRLPPLVEDNTLNKEKSGITTALAKYTIYIFEKLSCTYIICLFYIMIYFVLVKPTISVSK